MAGRNGAPQPNLGSCLPVSVACLFISLPRSSFYLSLREAPACLCPPIYWRVFAPYQIGDVSVGSFTGSQVSPDLDVDVKL